MPADYTKEGNIRFIHQAQSEDSPAPENLQELSDGELLILRAKMEQKIISDLMLHRHRPISEEYFKKISDMDLSIAGRIILNSVINSKTM